MKFESGKEYAKALVNGIVQAELETSSESRIPDELLGYFFKNIEDLCDQKYYNYIVGAIESYILTDTELEEAFNSASQSYVEVILDGLVDKNMLEISIGEGGDILYGLTPQGEQVVKKLNQNPLEN